MFSILRKAKIKLLPTPKLYIKCNELPIHNFNEVSASNDFNYLKKNPDDIVSEEVLQSAWLDILDEFLRISNNHYAANILKKREELISLKRKLFVLEAMKTCLMEGLNIDLEMKEYKVKPENLNANIGLMKNRISLLVNGLPEDSNDKKSETDFDRTIAVIMENGYPINRFKTTVAEYVAILNRIEQKNRNLKQQ